MNSIPTTRQTCTQGNLIGRLLLGLILLAVSNLPGFAQAPLTPTVSLRSSATVDPDDLFCQDVSDSVTSFPAARIRCQRRLG